MLDKNKPYALVYGRPGASFEQNGAVYAVDGSLAADEIVFEVEGIPDEEVITEQAVKLIAAEPSEQEAVEEIQGTSNDDGTVEDMVTVRASDKSRAASERMKAYWASKRARESNVED
jgi:hypothetical protein